MSDPIKVSVIIPVYNAMPYLRQNVESILQQSLREIEVIYVYDRSQDDSLDVLKEFQAIDKRIKIITSEIRQGLGMARNVGFDAAIGEYVVHLDADDYFDHRFLQLMYEKAIKTDADLVMCDHYLCDELNHTIYERRIAPFFSKRWQSDPYLSDENNRKYVLGFAIHCVWNKLCRASFLRKSGLRFQAVKAADDVFWGNAVIVAAKKPVYLGKEAPGLVYYRTNIPIQLTRDNNQNFLSLYDASVALFNFLKSKESYHIHLPVYSSFIAGCFGFLEKLSMENQRILFTYIKDHIEKDFDLFNYSPIDFPRQDIYRFLCTIFKSDYNSNRIIETIHQWHLCRYDERIFNYLRGGMRRTLLWGAGTHGKYFYQRCKLAGINLAGVVDTDPKKQGTYMGSYKVLDMESIDWNSFDLILVPSSWFVSDILKELKCMHCNKPVLDVTHCSDLYLPIEECIYYPEEDG